MHQIGNGVLGPVYRTYEPNRDRLVAVKIFKIDLLPEQATALAEALQGLVEIGLEHPSIVMPLAAGIEGHTVYLAEEYVAGESLDIAVRHYAPAPLETALPYLAQLAGALDYARARGVGHGALHPRDIFLTPDEARATGFGITQALERIGVRPPVRRPFSAPERVAGREWSTPADVFALGAVAHELLTGKRPAGTGEVAPIAGAAAESHPELLRGVLARALADDPAARYATASAFVSALEAAAHGEGAAQAKAAPRELAVELDEEAAPSGARVEPAEELTFELDRGGSAALEPIDVFEHAAAPEPEPEPEPSHAPKKEPAFEPQPEPSHEADQEPSLLDLIPSAAPEPKAKRRPRRKPEPVPEQAHEPEPEPAPEPELVEPAREIEPPVAEPAEPEPAFAREPQPEPAFEPEPEAGPELEPQAPFAMAYEPEPEVAREPPVERVYTRAEPVPTPARPAILPFAIVGVLAVLVGFLAGYLVGSRGAAAPAAGPGSVRLQPDQAPSPAASRPPQAAVQPPAAGRQPAGPGSVRLQPEQTQPPAAGREWSEAKVEPSPAPAPAAKAPAPETPAIKAPVAKAPPKPPAAGHQPPAASRQSPAAKLPAAKPPAAGSGTLVADSRPPGARVVLDGRVIGKTPLKLTNVKAGLHTVRFEIDGYRVWSTEVTVVAGRDTRVTGSLDRVRNP